MDNQQVAGWYPNPTGSGELRYWDGSAWTSHTASPATKSRTGFQVSLVGFLILIAPIIVAAFGSLTSHSSMVSEGGEGAGAALWGLIISIPIGLIVIITGAVIGATNKAKQRK